VRGGERQRSRALTGARLFAVQGSRWRAGKIKQIKDCQAGIGLSFSPPMETPILTDKCRDCGGKCPHTGIVVLCGECQAAETDYERTRRDREIAWGNGETFHNKPRR